MDAIMNYQFQGNMMEFIVGGAVLGGVGRMIMGFSSGEFPLGEVIFPAIGGGMVGAMIFFFYSGTR